MRLNDLFKQDLSLILDEVGVGITYNGITASCLLSHEPTEVLSMNDKQFAVQDTTLTAIIATGSLGTLKNNTTIIVDSKTYKITKYIVLSNGLEQKIWLIGA